MRDQREADVSGMQKENKKKIVVTERQILSTCFQSGERNFCLNKISDFRDNLLAWSYSENIFDFLTVIVVLSLNFDFKKAFLIV